jgi:hypothetical protein
MATTTRAPRTQAKPTFESVWAMFQETKEMFRETDCKFQATDLKFQEMSRESDRKFQETRDMFQATDLKFQATDRQFQETKELVKNLGKQIGGLHNSLGHTVELLMTPDLTVKFQRLGYDFTK